MNSNKTMAGSAFGAVFVATKNETNSTSSQLPLIMDQLNQISDSVHDGLQRWFDAYLMVFNNNMFLADVFGSFLFILTIFWVVGAMYTALDLLKWPHFLYQYKTQDEEVTWSDVVKTVKVSLLNQLTVQLATSAGFHVLTSYVRPLDESYKVPGWGTIATHLVVFALCQEVSFYYLHRLLHSGRMYRTFHKMHHYWQAPIAIAALYCHPFEHFLGNMVPVLLGPLIMGSHRCIICIWLLVVHVVTLNDHSGYHFPLMPSPEFHDYHHLKFNQNYGRMGFLDYLHGTSDRYLKSKFSKRHQVLMSLTPIKQLIPDDQDDGGKGALKD